MKICMKYVLSYKADIKSCIKPVCCHENLYKTYKTLYETNVELTQPIQTCKKNVKRINAYVKATRTHAKHIETYIKLVNSFAICQDLSTFRHRYLWNI